MSAGPIKPRVEAGAGVYALLFLSIALEVVGSLAMKASEGLTRFWPSVLLFSAFIATLSIMAYVSTKLPLSLIYPTWAALGTAGAVIGAMVMFGERLTAQQVAAIVVIIVGVALLHGPSLFNRG